MWRGEVYAKGGIEMEGMGVLLCCVGRVSVSIGLVLFVLGINMVLR
jgi:hypothetical protein